MEDRGGVRMIVVAVDGPAGSGKSSVSRAAAVALQFSYLDTGAAYRALAWSCLRDDVDVDDTVRVIDALERFDYEIGTDPDDRVVRVGGVDVTLQIREPAVSRAVSAVAKIPRVRQYLVDLFRSLIQRTGRPGIIVEGRDITTVVAPDAAVRILLTASEEARMARRSAEVSGIDAAATAHDLTSRDAKDSLVVDFMNASAGVVTIDSTPLDFASTVDAVVGLVLAATRTEGHPMTDESDD